MTSDIKFAVRRWARRITWPKPGLYFFFGLMRSRGSVYEADHRLYISGYPRSGNTFAVKAFRQANPGVPVRSHEHIPTFVVQSVRRNLPGMVLLRNPLDAAISWSIYTREPLQETLGYYRDYYSVLLRYREDLFVVSFEDVTRDFGGVIQAFNKRWRTDYMPFDHVAENVAECMNKIEAEYVDSHGKVIESKVPRPSIERQAEKQQWLETVNRSASVQKQLERATELYQTFRRIAWGRQRQTSAATRSIQLRPAV